MKCFRLAVILFLVTLVPVLAQTNPAAKRPWVNRSLSPEKRAELLVHAMTLDEKISQIHMRDVKEAPREVIGIDRLELPPFKISNGPAGAGPGDSRKPQPATALPSALALAAAWDPKLAETFGRVAAEEIASRGEHLLEAPGLNIARVPQNGRNFEYFGEDPFLTGRLGVAETDGIQSAGIIAEPKHYAANNQENQRKTINEVIDERTLREIYLPAFEATVKEANPGAIMCAYPSVNGHFDCENVHLLKEVLRGEWGFKGFVQSDYTATRSAVANANAGEDLSMKPEPYDAQMKAAIASGQVSENTLNTMLIRRFSVMFRIGWFDHPPTPSTIPARKNGAIAREIGEQGAVLLKNDGHQLPLKAGAIKSVALIGPYAGAAHTGGGGSSAVTPLYTVSPEEGLRDLLGSGVSITYNDGSDPQTAATLAKSADVALVMVGNKDRENVDRPNLLLPNQQDDLIDAVAAANPHTIVVLKTGGAVLMPWIDKVPAVLEAWYPGEEDGTVVADLLFGKANPSGKLPLTFPKTENQVPANTPEQYPGVNGVATYSEKLEVGYRWYNARNVVPLFPFGFGLSYTTFQLQHLKLSKSSTGDTVVGFDITNTGDREGADVVQVYVSSPEDAGEPPKQLRGFRKLLMRPHQTQHASIIVDKRSFSVWNTDLKKWTIVPGAYDFYVGDSARDLSLHGSINIGPESLAGQ
ncbi:MAG TPA: glycoside hydrolase family 3 C-terminal domain-containing protein [Terriglobales bacterium]|nr:glycoside hydrolase family 3 C-terminal domain-containing protein [Terriglobales bacterium]